MHKEEFKKWLPEHGINGGAIDDYAHYANKADQILGGTLDTKVKELVKDFIAHVNELDRQQNGDGASIRYNSGLKKYISFLLDTKKV